MKIISTNDSTPTLCVVENGQIVEQFADDENGQNDLFTKYNQEYMENKKWCGNAQCACSTGIHDGLTFGSGHLDDMGYWQNPCRVCAAAHDYSKPTLRKQYGQLDWVELNAWPFVDSDIEKLNEEITSRLLRHDEQWREFDELFGECEHNEMTPNDGPNGAWKCATCGYVYN
jgi:hypothetical protein